MVWSLPEGLDTVHCAALSFGHGSCEQLKPKKRELRLPNQAHWGAIRPSSMHPTLTSGAVLFKCIQKMAVASVAWCPSNPRS